VRMHAQLRKEMVQDQLAARGIKNPAVLKAMGEVPREEFLPEEMVGFAYEDSALPIEQEQTISQPYIVALMTEALGISRDDRVLEIGTESGYAAAVLAEIAQEVYTVERHGSLAAHPDSYERLCHLASVKAFLLPLREGAHPEVREKLKPERLERALGVIYRPETELASHYFQASLPFQFDEYIWFDRTQAIAPLPVEAAEGMPDTYPVAV
jgi:predicted O-methyltransferase YrrM